MFSQNEQAMYFVCTLIACSCNVRCGCVSSTVHVCYLVGLDHDVGWTLVSNYFRMWSPTLTVGVWINDQRAHQPSGIINYLNCYTSLTTFFLDHSKYSS